MMGENEEATLRLLDEHNDLILPIVKKNGGEVLKFIGDALLASYESAVDAVRAGTEIQSVLAKRNETVPEDRKIMVRIGIHIGDVVLRENDIFGDGVNVASRIEPLAEPGGICISQAVYDMVKGRPEIKAISLGMKELKNIKDSVHIYKVLLEAEEGRGDAREAESFREKKHKEPAPKKERRGMAWKFVAFIIVGIAIGLYFSGYLEDILYQDPWEEEWMQDDLTQEEMDSLFQAQILDQNFRPDMPENQINQEDLEDFIHQQITDRQFRPNRLEDQIDQLDRTNTEWKPPRSNFNPSKAQISNLPKTQVSSANWLSTNQLRQYFNNSGIDYDLNGDGYTDARYWSYDSNLDGVDDYGAYDTNLNGYIDQWLYYRSDQPNGIAYGFDSDEDGIIEAWGWDTNGDKKTNLWGWDNNGDNRTDTWGWDRNRNSKYDLIGWDTDWDGLIDSWGDDSNEDGIMDYWAWDQDGNNVFDRYGWDTDGDGQVDQWGDDLNEDGVIDQYY